MKAYAATQHLIDVYRILEIDAGKLRFRLNFGTDRCQDCDGLRAGPGVAATCFQVQRCNFTNIKDGEVAPRHLRILESLGQAPIKKS